MARKPKTQPGPDDATSEAPVPMRRGRKAKAGSPSPEAPPTMGDNTAASDGGSNAAAAGEAPRRQGPNRKAKTPSAAAARDDGQDAAPASPPEAAASADPVSMDAGSGSSSGDAQQPLPGLDTPAPAKPAAQWDRATDTVRFDWPAIEQTAAAAGPNQGMARLLLAARADGANSRWPL